MRSPPAERLWLRIGLGLWCVLAVAHGIKTFNRPDNDMSPDFSQAGAVLVGRPAASRRHRFSLQSDVCDRADAVWFISRPYRRDSLELVQPGLLVFALRRFCRHVVQERWPHFSEGKFLSLCMAGSLHGTWSGQSNSLVIVRGSTWRDRRRAEAVVESCLAGEVLLCRCM